MSPRRLLGTALGAWGVIVALGLALGAPLTGDEAAYALLARGTSEDWLYRPRGMVVLAEVGVALGGGELAMRLATALLSVAFVAAVAAVGRRAFGPWVGAWSAALVVGAHPFVLRAPELLGDLPAATCMLAALAIILGELDREGGPRYRLVATAPLLAAAFYLRYGSAPVIGMITAGATIPWWRAAWSRPGPILATAAVLVALVAPFVIASRDATGSIVGILLLSREVASHEELGNGLRAFVLGNPFATYGALLPPVLLAGLASVVRPPPARRRVAWFLAALAIGQVVAIGLVGHGTTRYIFFAIALLVILGVDAIARAVAPRPAARQIVIRVAGVAVAAAWLVLAALQPRIQRHITDGLTDLLTDARAIRADAAGRPCEVAALAVPQLMWYSGCDGIRLAAPGTRVPLAPDRRWYAASTPNRPVDPAVLGRAQGVEPIALPSPSAWYLRPR